MNDSSQAGDITKALSSEPNQSTLGIQEIFAGSSLREKLNSPLNDPRTPDIILKVNTGVIFTGGSKIAEHGGLNGDDTHVALLFSMPDFTAKHLKTYVLNQKVAPTIIQALGLDPNELKAVQIEGINPLPFLF